MTQEELKRILGGITRKGKGVLTPQAVVDAAEPDDHPLHDRFEWDNEVAGPLYRLEQAREIIRSVNVGALVVHAQKVRVPVYVRNPDHATEGSGYVPLSTVDRESQGALLTLRDEMARVVGATRRALAVAGKVGRPGLDVQLATLLAQAEGIGAGLARSDQESA